MSRNTVDFDDLLASLDDLTTTTEPSHHEESHHHYEEPSHHKRRDSSSSSSSSSDDEAKHHHQHHDDHHDDHHHDDYHHDDHHDHVEEISFHAPPPPPVAAPPPPAPTFKAKAVAATPMKPKQAPTPVVAKPALKPVHSQPAQPAPAHHQAQSHHQPQSHNRPSGPSSGDLRNHARQSVVVSPARGGSKNDSCSKCGQHFDGEYVTALNKAFCRHHFTCHDCGTQLHSSFFDHHGNTICENCAGNLLPCTKCHRGITGQYVIQDGKPHHKDCVEKWVCAKCHRDVEDVVTNALGKHWHKQCFVCQKCNAQLGGSFVNDNGFPTCQNCATKGLPKCQSCSRELVGDYTSFDGRGYHNECFKCQKCHTKLQLSGFYNVQGQHVCERCAHAR